MRMQWEKKAPAKSYRSVFIFTHFSWTIKKLLATNVQKKWTTTTMTKKKSSCFFSGKKKHLMPFLLKDKMNPWSEQSREKQDLTRAKNVRI